MFDQVGASAEYPVLGAGAAAAAVAEGVLGCSALSLSLAETQQAALSLHRARQSLEAAHLHLVRLLAAQEVQPVHRGAATRHFLADELGLGRGGARADYEAAVVTDPETGVLRGLGAALAAGEVQRAHVDVAGRAVRALPTGLVRDRRADVDQTLTEHAKAFCPTDAKKLAAHLLATVDPQGVEESADEAFERRGWTTRVDRSGMVGAEGALDPVGGAEYLAVLDHLSRPGRPVAAHGTDPGGGGDGGADGASVPGSAVDLRTRRQREADAQVEMARLAARALQLELPGAEPPRLVIHTTVEQMAAHTGRCPEPGEVQPTGAAASASHASRPRGGGAGSGAPPAWLSPGPATCEQTGPISSSALHRHACDALVERVVLDRAGAVVSMTSVGRLATRAQRRALAARDGGCTWPGCSAPPTWCDAHHVVWWSRGGATVLENLVLLCGRHHTEAHREQWTVTMVQGVPWFVPPRWVDPDRRPVRNTFHVAAARTRALGARLVRGEPLEPDADRPP